MAIDAAFPTLSSPTQSNSLSVSPNQARLSEGSGETTQTESAVTQAEESQGAAENGVSSGNKEGRGQLVDIRV